jgi:predicted RNA-binding protein with PUA-like domain
MEFRHWLVKQEPEDFAWTTFVKDRKTSWSGVRNFQARNFLRQMKQGDPVLFYHSGLEKRVVGLARVARESYADPTADEGDWAAVDLAPWKTLEHPVTLATIKADRSLREIHLVRNGRLSVMPLTPAQFDRLLHLAETKL